MEGSHQLSQPMGFWVIFCANPTQTMHEKQGKSLKIITYLHCLIPPPKKKMVF